MLGLKLLETASFDVTICLWFPNTTAIHKMHDIKYSKRNGMLRLESNPLFKVPTTPTSSLPQMSVFLQVFLKMLLIAEIMEH